MLKYHLVIFYLKRVKNGLLNKNVSELKKYCRSSMAKWGFASIVHLCTELEKQAALNDDIKTKVIEVITYLNDIPFSAGDKKRSSVLDIFRTSLSKIFRASPNLSENSGSVYSSVYSYVDFATRNTLRAPKNDEKILIVNARDFQPEGKDCDAQLLNDAYRLGWKRFICYGYKGQRFTGCGFGKKTDGVRIDVYDSSGDYLASGIDGMEVYVHGNAQDQLGQIMKRGKLVVFGDTGQTFMYGAKGGEVYIMENAAGRPLINATGHPRVVINGTCLDYLAESFMAGDPLNGGGFVILNGMEFTDDGNLISQPMPYPGSNLFSLASGGAIYLRDPYHKLVKEQLNGGEFIDLSPDDWDLILPYLQENEKLFGISIENDLLTVDGKKKNYKDVYRKVQAVKLAALSTELAVSEEYDEEWDEV